MQMSRPNWLSNKQASTEIDLENAKSDLAKAEKDWQAKQVAFDLTKQEALMRVS